MACQSGLPCSGTPITPHELSYAVDDVVGLRMKMEHLKTLLIANRAEIATRILKTARCVEIAELLSSRNQALPFTTDY